MIQIQEKLMKIMPQSLSNFQEKLNIRTKLIYVFIFLVLMIACAGGSGLFFTSQIKGKVETISDIAAPIGKISNALANDMFKSHVAVLSLLSMDTPETIGAKEKELQSLKINIDKNLDALSKVLKKGKFNLNIKQLTTIKNKFFGQIVDVIGAHQTKLSKEVLAKEKVAEFDTNRKNLDQSLIVFIQTAQTAIGEKEDEGRKLSMTETTTAKEVSDLLLSMFQRDLPVLYKGQDFRSFFIEFQDMIKTLIVEKETQNVEKLKSSFEKLTKKISGRMKRLKRKLRTKENKESFEILASFFETFKTTTLADDGIFIVQSEYIEAIMNIEQMKQQLSSASKLVNLELEKVLKVSDKINKDVQASAKKGVVSALIYISIIVSAGLIIGFFAAFIIINAITKPLITLKEKVQDVEKTSDFSIRVDSLKHDEVGRTALAFDSLMSVMHSALADVNHVMESVSKGDFSKSLTSEQKGDLDQLKESINGSIDLLGQSIAKIIDLSEQVKTNSEELTQSATTLSDNTDEQSAGIEEISASMTQIESRAKDNTQKALEVQKISGNAMKEVDKGNTQMTEMLASMEKIKKTSADVSNVIQVINDIASQTKLLSLNASIEAVRAGDAGRGFAVVADEVRDLANRSAQAATETTKLIKDSIKEIDKGAEHVDHNAEVLNKIHNIVNQVNTLVLEISEFSADQSTSIEGVTQGLSHINKAVVENSSIAKQTVDAYEQMSEMSHRMFEILKVFKLR
ncbi:MAG: methyl-accepting chemotaxis protein [Desulfobacteraceae bacterium]|nr:methyl-accepting chemotaxis protein [Desulfobacteraceae bacterium]